MWLAVVALLALAAPAAPSALLWTPAVQREYQQLVADVRQERWTNAPAAQQAGHAALRLATFSAALLTRLPRHSDDPRVAQRVRQLETHINEVNIGKVELDALLRRTGKDTPSDDEISEAFKNYLSRQESMATSFDLESAEQLAWSPFSLASGADVRSRLEQLWSRVQPLYTGLSGYLRGRPAPAGADRDRLMLECAAGGDCNRLVQMALPYPDTSSALSDLLREKRMGAEELALLADSFLRRLQLPAAPVQLWQLSKFAPRGQCRSQAAADRVQLCEDGDMAGLRAALDVMARSAYLRTASKQTPPFDAEPYPGFGAAVSGCVALLALQPQVALQSVYGYGTDGASSQPVSLYLSGGARPPATPDALCGGDVACQLTTNWLLDTAVTQLLPLGYHVASLHWLAEAGRSPAPLSAWRRHLQHTLGVAVGADVGPARLDPAFYSLQRHAAGALSRFAAFQLHEAACPAGADCVTKGGAQRVLTSVMEAGSSQPWDTLLSAAAGTTAPTAAPLVAFFQPLQRLISPVAAAQKHLKTLELEEESPIGQRGPSLSAGAGAGYHAPVITSPCVTVVHKTLAEEVLCDFNEQSDAMVAGTSELEWELADDVRGDAAQELVTNMTMLAELMAVTSANLSSINVTDWINDPEDPDEQKLFMQMAALANSTALNQDKLTKLLESTAAVYTSYIDLMVCPHDDKSCDDKKLSLWDLQQLMKSTTNLEADDLMYYWDQYRAVAKTDMQDNVTDYVTNANALAQSAGYDHYGLMWLEPYGLDDQQLLLMLGGTWAPLDPLYKKLHAYVRFQLKSVFKGEADGEMDPLPAHLLGDMYAENWVNIYNRTKPDDGIDIDITSALKDKNYSVVQMTHDANDFLTSLKLDDFGPNTYPSFQFESELNETSCARHRDCRPLAWNDGADADIRLRMVNTVDMDSFETVHNRMAALEYYVQYMGQDPLNRQPANPAFTDAVAGAISLSALNPKHLMNIHLLDDFNATVGYDNFLYRRALQYLVPLPFDFISQSWLWDLYRGQISSSNWNHRWWTLREDYQGVRPANRRSASNSDPLALPVIGRALPPFQRYFSTVLQFQLFEFFCIQAGQYDRASNSSRLVECDLTGVDLPALRDLMAAGRTRPWMELVEMYTVAKNLSSDAMINYFAPLVDRLDIFIKDNNLKAEWESNLDDYWDNGSDDTDNTVPIVVGVVLGVFVLIVLIAYFVVRMRRNREE